jgi:outer membrane protein assembly factor BamA
LKEGEIYNRDKYYVGLRAVTAAYDERGFIDCTTDQTMELDEVNQTVRLVLQITEGPKYRWGNVQVLGLDPEMEAVLRSRVLTGSPVNRKLIRDFYNDYRSLLPVGASPENVKWKPDSQRAVVDLTFDFSHS